MEAIKLKRIVIKEELYAITNDTIECIILGQFIYWQERVKDYDLFLKEEEKRCLSNETPFNVNMSNGWIYKKASELIEECMLNVSENTIRRYISNLEEKGFISSRKNPNVKWDRTLQYRANMKFIIESIKNKGFDGLGGWNIQNEVTKLQNDDSNSQNGGALPEITIENTNIKEDTNVSKKDCNCANDVSEQVEELYAMYPTKCPKRNISLGKSFKCKDKIRKLIKQYGYEMLKFTISKECEEKYGKSYMLNFSTFLNNLPDYGYVKSESNESSEITDNKSNDININGVTYK